MEVSAKDKATGKQQSIRITHSSGLPKDEIDRLVKDAELNAAEDKTKKELADARNSADALIYSTEKILKESGNRQRSFILPCHPKRKCLQPPQEKITAMRVN